jgi:hypothetical protein
MRMRMGTAAEIRMIVFQSLVDHFSFDTPGSYQFVLNRIGIDYHYLVGRSTRQATTERLNDYTKP